jgi:ParB-like chromosome segregation protein Spo0J
MSLRLNPIYEKLLPQMTEEEFAELKASIKSEGQHYAIIVNEDLEVLDGHHRYRACMELGIEPDFEVRKFDDKLLEKKFVIEANLRRRHLNNFQLVELAVPLLEIEKTLAKQRQSKGGKDGRNLQLGIAPEDAEPETVPEFKGKATETVAKRAGVSPRTFERGKKIIEEASEDDKQKLREGKTSISQVYNDKTASQKPPQPERELKPPSAYDLQNITNLQALLEQMERHQLFCSDCGNGMFECSKCHKTLKELLKEKPS